MIISNSQIDVGVQPKWGGSLSHLRFGGRHVFRPLAAQDGVVRNPIDTGCFPLVPFSNRIAHGRFTFDGRKAALNPNMGDHPHAIHGQGWLSEWNWARKTDTTGEMLFDHQAAEWPWSYSSCQRLLVLGDSLRHEISVTNKSPHPMPAGIGLHPQFIRTPDCSIQAGTEFVWLTTPDGIPTKKVPVPDEWELSNKRHVSRLSVDHCFAEWNGWARIEWPETGSAVTISADEPFDHLVVFVPQKEDFFCVEPVSHMPNALNQNDPAAAGVVTLKPKQELAAGVTYHFEVI